MQQENMRPHRNIETNEKPPDERYKKIKLMTKNPMKKIRSVKLTRKNN